MAHWDDGYVSDVTYTSGYHNETPPVWLAAAATLSGFTAPDLTRPFRYADLGCGNGVTALVVAATMPHAEVWACDFNPAHVENGRDTARRAGLTNIHFEEASFVGGDEGDDDPLDPGALLLVMECLAKLCRGVGVDPQSGSLM